MKNKAEQLSQQLSRPGAPVEVRLSARRKKTISARWEGRKIILLAPAAMSTKRLAEASEELVEKLLAKSARSAQAVSSDAALQELAEQLNATFLEGRAEWESIRWVGNMSTRWGSCTPGTGRIRISDRLQHVPDYVLHSVIIHELVHTWVPNHGPDFWAWAGKAPQLDRARGYLEAYQRWGSV